MASYWYPRGAAGRSPSSAALIRGSSFIALTVEAISSALINDQSGSPQAQAQAGLICSAKEVFAPFYDTVLLRFLYCIYRQLYLQLTHQVSCLFAEMPRRTLLGNLAYLTREGRSASAKARRESGSPTNTMMRSATTSVTEIRAFSAAPDAKTTPGALKRKLSAELFAGDICGAGGGTRTHTRLPGLVSCSVRLRSIPTAANEA